MPVESQVRDLLLSARQDLKQGRERLREQHDAGAPGGQICGKLSDLLDTVLIRLYRDAIEDICGGDSTAFEERIAVVACGGYGRREVSPFSDVDLTVLHEGRDDALVEALARRLTQDVFDIGLQLGLSVRTPRQAIQLALRDATIFTSLSESRFLAGNVQLFERSHERLSQTARRRFRVMIELTEEARREERRKFGETVFLLRPNIKRSRGALRDIQLVGWVGFARYGETDIDKLFRMGVLSKADRRSLLRAREFLLRVRNELHFHAGRSQDVFGKREQVRVAERFGYEGNDAALPVEKLMSDYFRFTSEVRYSSAHFIASAKTRTGLGSIVGPFFSTTFEGDFRVGPFHVGATRQGMDKVKRNLVDVLRLMELSNSFNRRIDHPTWQAIRDSMISRTSIDLTVEAAERFMALMAEPTRLAALLRRLHEMRVLEKIIPEFKHARGLLQFNEYHQYTVDEHSLRAVEHLTQYMAEDSPFGKIYRSLKQKQVLHLAILLHDVGKGYNEDHSEVGLRIVAGLAGRLNLNEHDTEAVKFLVHKHLMMAHMAFRRDLSDDSVIASFAAEVGSVEMLKMLTLLTCSDLAAVGPDVLNDWKLSLLLEMYLRVREQLDGRNHESHVNQDVVQAIEFSEQASEDDDESRWFVETIRQLPAQLVSQWPAVEIYRRLTNARNLETSEVDVQATYLADSKSVEYALMFHDRPRSGYFHKLTGVLSSRGMEILSADVTPIGPTLIINRFRVLDLDHEDEPPRERIDAIIDQLRQIVLNATDEPPTFRTVWGTNDGRQVGPLNRLPTRVHIDNDTAEGMTVLDVFAHDRVGLLYTITRALYELELEVRYSKIGTFLDQVVDVFYVTKEDGQQVTDDDQIRNIRDSLLNAIEEFEQR